MRSLAGLLIILPSIALAGVCKPASKEMERFQDQKTWEQVKVEDSQVTGSVNGWVDRKNNFYFENLTRRGSFRAQVEVARSNQGYDDFFEYCKNFKDEGEYLISLREENQQNKYQVRLKYLPSFEEFANNPLKDQKVQDWGGQLELTFSEDSITAENTSKNYMLKVKKSLQEQMSNQGTLGEITLDLSGRDEVVCDLIRGNAKITAQKTLASNEPKIEQVEKVKPADISTIYRGLGEKLEFSNSKEKNLFLAGQAFSKLQDQGDIEPMDADQSFDVLKKLMNKDLSQLERKSQKGLQCVADQMQEYKEGHMQHLFNIGFQFDSLAEVKSSNSGVNND